MSIRTLLATLLSPDPPVQLNANWFLDKVDRQYIDDQIRTLQIYLSSALLRGQHATWVKLDPSSAAGQAGDCVCSASTVAATEDDPTTAIRLVTRALASPMATSGLVAGIMLTAGAPGTLIPIATSGIIGPSITGLASGSSGNVKLNTSTARCQLGALSSGSFPIGHVDSVGNLSIARGLSIP